MSSDKKGFKPYLGLTFLIGFGFFTISLMGVPYDTYVPIFLGKYMSSMTLIGLIMTIDNLLALFLIPVVSAMSDRTHTRIGRRMPYIVSLLPLCAVFFGALPYAAGASLGALIAIICCLNITKQAAYGPVVALMPDIIPADYRSEANGIINTMGGIASVVSSLVFARLMDVGMTLPIFGSTKGKLPFILVGILVVVAVILLVCFVKEKKNPQNTKTEKKEPLFASFKAVASQSDKSALYILLSLFLWFLGYQGVLPFIGKYSVDVLKTSSGQATLAAGMVGIAYAIFAAPSGYFAHKHGRKKTIRFSLGVIAVLMVLLFFHQPLTAGLSPKGQLYTFWGIMFLFGMFWVSIVTNSFPMLWQMASWGTIGVYTGLYYTASQSAAIVAPIVTGALIDWFGYRSMYLFSAICMLAAFLVMSKVKKGEPEPKPE
ncbi:MAG: MFS transporter [Spirochaetaceae bacterium]|nr:MFS transporter [Spirochaetaceae bacterium]